jgi:hypothetical protein
MRKEDPRETGSRQHLKEGVVPGEIGLFVRSVARFPRARAVLEQAGIPYTVLDERLATNSATASLCSMHLAKGLEFRTVVVLACDDDVIPLDVIPLKERIEAVGDDFDLEEVYSSERNLLYVACTRARDQLFASGVNPGSSFWTIYGSNLPTVIHQRLVH